MIRTDRRSFLKAAGAVALLAGCGGSPIVGGRRAVTFRNGLSVSPFAEGVLEKGVTFSDALGRTAKDIGDLQQLLMAHGSTEVFARLGSRLVPSRKGSSRSGMAATLERAQMAHRLGLPLNPELLLCADYGDESYQPAPDFSDYPQIRLKGRWSELGIEAMCDAMRAYGEEAARRILETGVTVNVWDIGNEVDFGIAGVAMPPLVQRPGFTYEAPDAVDPEIGRMTAARFFAMAPRDRVAWGQTHLWVHVGRILAAVADGIRKVDASARCATHVGGLLAQDPESFAGFFESIAKAGFDSEVLGASFYPTAYQYFPLHPELDRFTVFKQTAELAMRRLGKPVYVAEFGYAADALIFGGRSWANPVEGYPISADGQARFLRDLVDWGLEGGRLAGVRPWAPDFVGSGWQPMALFETPMDGVATARPGLSSIHEGSGNAVRARDRA